MRNNKQKEDRRERMDKNDSRVTPEMTSAELIESIRGKIQQALAKKAKEPGHRR